MVEKTTESAVGMLRKALGLREGETPFPWQAELLRRFTEGTIDRAVDIPTGLGKTAVMAIWLVARAHGAPIPRRLVYVVDRRAVVDQATAVAEGLRAFVEAVPEVKHALGLGNRQLPISTLRGQHLDNRDWLEDPSAPAIIVGTVDMIGSRLLFGGYGASRKMQPYHAGLLGADVLLVLDEAHLVPPFEALVDAIATNEGFQAEDLTLRALVPGFRLLSLSATGRLLSGVHPFGLQLADLHHPIVTRRLKAEKRITLERLNPAEKLSEALAARAWKLAHEGRTPARVVVYSNKRDVAQAAQAALERIASAGRKRGASGAAVDTELFVGARRVAERTEVAAWLESRGFLAQTEVGLTQPAVLFSTSAGEVGVDLDAEHMVCDVVAWERMVQRLGRVNRRGGGSATVIVVDEPEANDVVELQRRARDDLKPSELFQVEIAERREAVRQLTSRLPSVGDSRQGSPESLHHLKESAQNDEALRDLIDRASTFPPLRPALTRALVDAWSMTSLEQHTARPAIQPWLRGWLTDPPQTRVVWRRHLPLQNAAAIVPDKRRKKAIEDFFEAAPPHVSEFLETETFLVVDWLSSAASRQEVAFTEQDVVGIVLTERGEWRQNLRRSDIHVADDAGPRRKQRKVALLEALAGGVLILDARIAGLASNGMLDEATHEVPKVLDDGSRWVVNVDFSVRLAAPDDPVSRVSFQMPAKVSDEGIPELLLVVENGSSEDRRALGSFQSLSAHQNLAAERARALAGSLGLPSAYIEALELAARIHDEGKRSPRWQRAFNAKSDDVYAKTPGPVNQRLLDGYRHEFGSLRLAQGNQVLDHLTPDLRELVLHLIAAHHGNARPVIAVDGCDDAPPSVLEDAAQEVVFRFARLQRRWGPWGLAWWETLLRAADQQASRANERGPAHE